MRPLKMQHWQLFRGHVMYNDKFDFSYTMGDLRAFTTKSRISTFYPSLMDQNPSKKVHIRDPKIR